MGEMSTAVQFPLRAARAVVRRAQYVRSGTLRIVPLRWITNEFAFSFAPEGWNYFRALVAEYQARPELQPEDSILYRFFQHERVQAVRYLNDLLFLHRPECRDSGFQFALGTYPWGDHVGGGPWGHHFDHTTGHSTRDLYGQRANVWYQPGDPFPLQLEWEQTIRALENLRKGYRPLRAGQLPEVTLLIRRSGEYRAVRYNGQHRLAVLSHLGRKRLTVLVPSARSINAELALWPSASSLPKVVAPDEIVVRETEVDNWQYVKRGLCSREQALEIFHAFFELNGRERIQHLGLPTIY
jgi:hypothetical protein